MAKNDKMSWKKYGLIVGLGVSLALNAYYLATTDNNATGATYSGEATTDTNIYQEQVASLESEKESLTAEVESAKSEVTKAQEQADSKTDDNSSSDSNESKNNDTLNTELAEIAEKVVIAYATVDSKERQKDLNNDKLREALAPYVNEDLLKRMAPSQEDLEDPNFHGDTDAGMNQTTPPDYWSKSEVERTNVLVDQKTINEDRVYVSVEALTHHKDSSSSDFKLLETYNLFFEKEGNDWKVQNINYGTEVYDEDAEDGYSM